MSTAPTLVDTKLSYTTSELWDMFPGLAPDDFNALLNWFTVKHEGFTIQYAGHHLYSVKGH